MHCKRAWDRQFLKSVLPNTFLETDLKYHQQDILLTHELSQLPQTMEVLERLKDREKIMEQVRLLREEKYKIDLRIQQLLHEANGTETAKDNVSFRYQRPCPKQDCRGYLNIENGVCGVCNVVVCLECNVSKDYSVEHVCKEEDILVWKSLSESTRCCPSCQVRIFKVSGCNQMWCPHCRTAFNWVTGQIERGQVHNPHYYEWLFRQNNGNQAADAECQENQEIPHPTMIHYILSQHRPVSRDQWREFYRFLIHMDRVEIRRRTRRQQQESNEDLRIQYLENKITKEKLKQQLYIRHKRNMKNIEILRVEQMFKDVSIDILRNLINSLDFATADQSRMSLIAYFNESMRKVRSDFSGKVPLIFPNQNHTIIETRNV